MNRREALATLGSLAMAVPCLAGAQAKARPYRIGYLNLRSGPSALDEAFIQGLRESGYVEGRNIAIEYRWAGNDMARLQAQADELVRLNVAVIVAAATPAVRAAKRATSTIPIVIAAASDPAGTGLVTSLDHPGGNVTGLSLVSIDLARKRLQLAKELVPGLSRVAALGWLIPTQVAAAPQQHPTEMMIAETQAAGRQLGIEVTRNVVANANELARVLDELKRQRPQLLIVQNNSLVFENVTTILAAASSQRLPTMFEAREYVDAGGLVSYGPDVKDSYRRAAAYVDKILRGAKPGDLPVEQPTKFELVINEMTAKALKLVIPASMRVQAEIVS